MNETLLYALNKLKDNNVPILQRLLENHEFAYNRPVHSFGSSPKKAYFNGQGDVIYTQKHPLGEPIKYSRMDCYERIKSIYQK